MHMWLVGYVDINLKNSKVYYIGFLHGTLENPFPRLETGTWAYTGARLIAKTFDATYSNVTAIPKYWSIDSWNTRFMLTFLRL